MFVSQKTRYALRAVFQLAKSAKEGPVKIGDIAKVQAIPPRFLEGILNQLKQGGFVTSRRGVNGGYLLHVYPAKLTVADVIQFIQGPIQAVECFIASSSDRCPLKGDCVFLPMWTKLDEAMFQVLGTTTFQDLVDQERLLNRVQGSCYVI